MRAGYCLGIFLSSTIDDDDNTQIRAPGGTYSAQPMPNQAAGPFGTFPIENFSPGTR